MNSKLLVALVVLLGLVGGVNSFSDVEERFWPLFRTQQIFTSTYPHCEAHVTAINKTVNKMLRLRVGSGCEFTLEDSDGNIHVCRIQPDQPFPTGYRELFYGYVVLNQGKQSVEDSVQEQAVAENGENLDIEVSTIFETENTTFEQLHDSLSLQTSEPIKQTPSAFDFIEIQYSEEDQVQDSEPEVIEQPKKSLKTEP